MKNQNQCDCNQGRLPCSCKVCEINERLADQAGEAWDVLHANGVNSGGGLMTLAQAIQELIDRRQQCVVNPS